MSKSTARRVRMITDGEKTSDGAGVKMTRLIASHQLDMLDPFLLLDHFESDNPDDYIGGFPSHPHRGFETVTYMLAGNMRHKDSAGNEGVIGPHGVQWMTAGSGIIHSEMPEQSDGLMSGFQLWVNLPAKDKMTKPAYQESLSNLLMAATCASLRELPIAAPVVRSPIITCIHCTCMFPCPQAALSSKALIRATTLSCM